MVQSKYVLFCCCFFGMWHGIETYKAGTASGAEGNRQASLWECGHGPEKGRGCWMLPGLALTQSLETVPLCLPPLPQKTSRSSERKRNTYSMNIYVVLKLN